MDENRDARQDQATIRLARVKGRQLAGKYGFARDEAADIEQDLLLDYLKRSREFDSHRCSHCGFGRLVINNRVAAIITSKKAACRDHRLGQVPVDQLVEFPNTSRLGDILRDQRYTEAQLNLRLDIERVLRRLPVALMTICRLLMVCDSAVEAAARAGISRATLYRRLQEARRAFMEAGWAGAET